MRTLLLTTALLLTACAPRETAKAAVPQPTGGPLTWAHLTGAPFNLTAFQDNGMPVAIPEGRRPTIQFLEQPRVGGFAGVNRYGTAAELRENGGIAWTSGIIATKMAGPSEAMTLEDTFLKSLEKVSRIELKGDVLRLLTADGKTALEFSREK